MVIFKILVSARSRPYVTTSRVERQRKRERHAHTCGDILPVVHTVTNTGIGTNSYLDSHHPDIHLLRKDSGLVHSIFYCRPSTVDLRDRLTAAALFDVLSQQEVGLGETRLETKEFPTRVQSRRPSTDDLLLSGVPSF
jgi:hypothetical protein